MTYHHRRGVKKYIQFDWTVLTHQAINTEQFYFPINSADSGLLSITHLFSTEWESSLLTVQSDSIHFFCHLWLLKVSFLPLRLASLPFKTKHYHDCLTSVILVNLNLLHCFPEAQKIHTSSPCCLCTLVLPFSTVPSPSMSWQSPAHLLNNGRQSPTSPWIKTGGLSSPSFVRMVCLFWK